MGNRVFLTAHCKPTLLTKRMLAHSGDVSEGTRHKILAKRIIIGRAVTFYSNGIRVIHNTTGLNEQEMHESEILRLTHASLLTGTPVGDKRKCYVDAKTFDVEVWVYGMPVKEFIRKSKELVGTQQVDVDFLLEEPINKIAEKANV